jgi:aminopeptidase N
MLRPRSVLLVVACAACGGAPAPDYGVALSLAEWRAAAIDSLRYDLRFNVPAERTAPVIGRVTLSFMLSDRAQPLVLDFRGDTASIRTATVNGTQVPVRVVNGHVLIDASELDDGGNVVTLDFTAGNDALNRNDDFFYALFVPDRAATAFPSFDQPDLKGRYRLTLEVPSAWSAIANGAELSRDTAQGRATITFAETQPLSTYLFAFAAGRFDAEVAQRDGRTLTMYHRETDRARVARNRDAIFDLHATALKWLEDYTQIPYPFGKFAFLAVPSFQFGGMEHPGAIWYRATSLFLDESATQNQHLGRASVIAHETAHMWFGDLVTMRWFNDVWMKEVFANFFAAKIVQPSFPKVNHDLRFFLAHHATAYGVDRTLGANPIRQPLENLRQAGSLYGAIIYQRAPIVMRQLERLVGDSAMRAGMRTYLRRHQFANASWPDLIAILDELTPEDLVTWSRTWVEEAWRPQIAARWANGTVAVTQRDPRAERGLTWTQTVGVALGYGDSVTTVSVDLRGDSATIPVDRRAPDWILPGADGLSYGRFALDAASRSALLVRAPALADPIVRGAAYSALWESVLGGATRPADMLDLTLRALETEQDELLTQQLVGLMRSAYWRFLGAAERDALAPRVEAALWREMERAIGVSRKAAFWNTIVSVTRTEPGVARLRRVWAKEESIRGLPLSELQYTSLAEALAVRDVPDAEHILTTEAARITNPDRHARFAFVRPALSSDASVRDSTFRRLTDVANRARESWVLDALAYIGHPLRAKRAERYVEQGLALVPEIQRTGDIFFPLGWVSALLDGQQSPEVAEMVVQYLDTSRSLDARLRGKVLQAADDLFRAARIVHGWRGGPTLEGDREPR